MHEVVHIRVDSLNNRHQIIKNVFGVVHGRIHEVPGKEDDTREECFKVEPAGGEIRKNED